MGIARAFGASQCVHLPGPGHYSLNGYGRSVGANAQIRDYAVLHWQLRYDGGEQCNAGLFDSADYHSLGRSTSFFRPGTPAAINVPDERWTPNTSLTVVLTAEEGNALVGTGEDHGMSAWFDGITLNLNCDVLPPQLTAPFVDRTDPEGTLIAWDVSDRFSAPDAGFAWHYRQEGLPDGLSMSHAGVIQGRIGDAAAGSHAIRISADDLNGGIAEGSFVWTVTEAERSPAIFRDGFEGP